MKKAIAPGKIILSGEHAVVHGQPAIAMAVNRYAEASVHHHLSSLISFELFNLKYHKDHTHQALKSLKERLLKDYDKFQAGEKGIKDVLKLPMELAQFAVTNVLDKFNHKLTSGVKLKTHSDIPIGCGMGSSAATILAVIHAMANYLNIDLSKELYLSYGLEAENLQHGKSSGLDLQVSYHGGCILYRDGDIEQLPLPTFQWYLVNTGTRSGSTGECVSQVKHILDENLAEQFGQVTQSLQQALVNNDWELAKQSIQQNHQLLIRIGVVPETVQQFIHELEQQGCAAKICGAGAIKGDNAGVVIILSKQDPTEVCQQFGYQCEAIVGDMDGLRTV